MTAISDPSKNWEDTPTYDARDIVGYGVQAQLILDQHVYWLRITRAGKLILTK
ncbi:MAG: hemin uptake protein HemP [Pseudomonadota bacterium]